MLKIDLHVDILYLYDCLQYYKVLNFLGDVSYVESMAVKKDMGQEVEDFWGVHFTRYITIHNVWDFSYFTTMISVELELGSSQQCGGHLESSQSLSLWQIRISRFWSTRFCSICEWWKVLYFSGKKNSPIATIWVLHPNLVHIYILTDLTF